MFKKNTENIFIEGVDQRRIPNSITLHIIPTTFGLKWNTPKDILVSVLKNKFLSFNSEWLIGHVSVELCLEDGSIMYAGQTAVNFNEFQDDIFINHKGFGVLVEDIEGAMQDISDLKKNYGKIMQKANRIGFVTFTLPTEKINRIAEYLKEYQEKEAWHRYGLYNKPLKGQGSGCSAFASSCFQIIGLSELAQNWSRTIYIPNRLIGSDKNAVHAFKLLGESFMNWFEEKEPSYKLHFYDPELMWDWLQRSEVQSEAIKSYQVAESSGIVLNYTQAKFQKEENWIF